MNRADEQVTDFLNGLAFPARMIVFQAGSFAGVKWASVQVYLPARRLRQVLAAWVFWLALWLGGWADD